MSTYLRVKNINLTSDIGNSESVNNVSSTTMVSTITTGTSYETKEITSGTLYETRVSTSSTTYGTRISISDTSYETRAKTTSTTYGSTAITTATTYATMAASTATTYSTRRSTSATGYLTRSSTSFTGYYTRESTSYTGYYTRSSTSGTGYLTRASVYATDYATRASTSKTTYGTSSSWKYDNWTDAGQVHITLRSHTSNDRHQSVTLFLARKAAQAISDGVWNAGIPDFIRSYTSKSTFIEMYTKETAFETSYSNTVSACSYYLVFTSSTHRTADRKYHDLREYTASPVPHGDPGRDGYHVYPYLSNASLGDNKHMTLFITASNMTTTVAYTTHTGYETRKSTSGTISYTRQSTYATTYGTRQSTSGTYYETRKSTSSTYYETRKSTSRTYYETRVSSVDIGYRTTVSTTSTGYLTRSINNHTGYLTEVSTSNTKYLTRVSTSNTGYLTCSSTSKTKYLTQVSTSVTNYLTTSVITTLYSGTFVEKKENQEVIKVNITEADNAVNLAKVRVNNLDVKAIAIENNSNTINTNVNDTKDLSNTSLDDITVANTKVGNVNTNLQQVESDSLLLRSDTSDSANTAIYIGNDSSESYNKSSDLNDTITEVRATANREKNTSITIKDQMALKSTQNKILSLLNKVDNRRYGVRIKIDEPDPYTRVEYTHDAEGMTPVSMNYNTGRFNYGDWSDVWFIKDNYPCMLKYDGTVDYKLNPNDYSKKEDGTISDIDNEEYEGNAMSRFPLIWVSFSKNDDYEYITVCRNRYDDTYLPIGFVNDQGVVKPEMFISMFEGYQPEGSNIIRSLMNKSVAGVDFIRDEFTYATNNGSGWYNRTWAQRTLINALLTIISKSDNTQESFGNGYLPNSNYLNTGTLYNKGQFYGYNDDSHGMKIFHIENWWGNCAEFLSGLALINNKYYYKMNGSYPNFDSSATSNDYINNGFKEGPLVGAEGFLTSSYDGDYGRLPEGCLISSSSSTYQCDYFYANMNSSKPLLPCVGMSHSNSYDLIDYYGAHYMVINLINENSSNQYVNAGLSYIAPNQI